MEDNKNDNNKIEENKIEENKIEENKIEENKTEENKVEENKTEENKVEENEIDENKLEGNNIEENKEENKTDDNKAEKNKEESKKNKVKLTEKISLSFRRRFLVDGAITFLIIAILIVGYISLNLWVKELDLEDIDVTKNKIYTLSDASKQVVSKVNQDINIYAYGFTEDSNFINFLKQYKKVNDKIHYEILTDENNPGLIQQYSLKSGYAVVILECGDAKKVIDASTEFTTFDYTTSESIDITEQVMTNSILSLTEENKPKIYFLEGHKETNLSNMSVLTTFLGYEAFETDTLNLSTTNSIPEDCDILAIMSPTVDFFEPEVLAIKNYINNGGKIYLTMDAIFKPESEINFTNLQSIFDEYGFSVKNGYVIENEPNKYYSDSYPYLFIPSVSEENQITSDIYTSNSRITLRFASKLEYKSDDVLSSLGVTKETLLSSSSSSQFISNMTATTLAEALKTVETGSVDTSALFTKNITTKNEQGEEETKKSELIVVTCGSFIADTSVTELGSSYPLSAFGSNKDFVINGLSYLGKKENNLSIRKDIAATPYTATKTQDIIVRTIIFVAPLFIIFIGIVIWIHRKKRK